MATRGQGVAARVDGPLGGASVSERAAEDGVRFAVDEAAIGDAVAARVGQAVIGLAVGVGGDRQAGLADRQGPIGEGDRVVAGGLPAGGEDVAAGVDRTLRGAGVSERPAEDGVRFGVDEPDVGDAVAAGVG